MTETLSTAHRLVIKVGSRLTLSDDRVNYEWIDRLGRQIALYHSKGKEIVIVSSGSVAIGRRCLQLKERVLKLEEKQASAAIGQTLLTSAYQNALTPINIAQLLLTLEDTEDRRRHLNVRETLKTLLRCGVVPVINENDTVATVQIGVGDNDRLAARVSQMISADTLVLLSDIDGFYTANPYLDPTAVRIPEIKEITPEMERAAQAPLPGYSSGGMKTKLIAAKIAMNAGCRMVLTDGSRSEPLTALDREGTPCSWFLPSTTPYKARKLWIASHLQVSGSLTIDGGAIQALRSGRSLLPAGVTDVAGRFRRGDLVAIHSPDNVKIGSGLCSYSASEARKIIGKKSQEFEEILGYHGRDEMIHRDNLVLTPIRLD